MLNWTELLTGVSIYNHTVNESTIVNIANSKKSKIYFEILKKVLTETKARLILCFTLKDYDLFYISLCKL